MPDSRRAWAAALFEAAPDVERRVAYAEALGAISLAMSGSEGRALREFLREPSVARGRKAEVLASTAEPLSGGKPDPLFSRFCALVVAKGRTGLLPAMAVAYRSALDSAQGVSPLEIEAAREIPSATVQRIAAAWRKASGAASVRSSVRVRPELVAGYRLRSGSIRLDYSIAGRVERLTRELAKPLAANPPVDRPAGGWAGGRLKICRNDPTK